MKKPFVLLFLAIFIPSLVFAQTTATSSDLQALVKQLQAQVQALQQQINALQAELGKEPQASTSTGLPVTSAGLPATPAGETPASASAPETTPPELTRSLSRGTSGDDVRKLQEFLSKDKDIYPEGLLTGFFGPLTEAAVKKWQEKHKIEAVGIVGPKTISKLQDIGRGVVQGLLERGAGASGIVPPGLLIAPGIQSQLAIATSTVIATTSVHVASTTLVLATTTPSGTIPAVPAVPATPIAPASGVGTAIPATPAVPAQPVTTTTATTTTTTTTTVTTAVPPTPTNPAVNVYYDNVGKWYYGVFSFLDSPHSVYDGSWGNKIYRNGILLIDRKIYNIEPNFYTYSHYDTNLPLSTTYTYTVATYNPAGTSAQSSPVSITTPASSATSSSGAVPIAPSLYGSFYGGTGTSVNFTWSDNSTTDETGFQLYTRPAGSTEWRRATQSDFAAGSSQMGITDYKMNVGVHEYKLNTCNSYGCSPDSNIVSLTFTASTFAATPTNLTASANGSNVTLQWTDNATNETRYQVYQMSSDGSLLTYVGQDFPINTTSAVHSGVPVGTYKYGVNACASIGCSLSSNHPTVTVSGAVTDTTAPSIPTNLTASPSSTQVTLSWTASTDNIGVTGYEFHRNGVLDATTNLNTGYVVYGLQPSTTYTFVIVAYDAAGNISNRATILATTLADTTPPTVSNVAVTNITSTSATISWTSNEPSTSRVEYSATDQGVICWNSSCPIAIFGTSLVTAHSGTLSGLQPSTIYYFRAKSIDAAGNVGGSLSQFTTSPAATTATTSAISSDRDLAAVLKSLSAVLQKLQEALR